MNVSQLLSIAAAIVPDRDATVFDGRRVSYGELQSRAERFGAGLSTLCGISPGDRVAWMDTNSDLQVEAIFGTALAGGIFVPVNYRARDEELAFVLKDSGSKVLLVGARYMESVKRFLDSDLGSDCCVDVVVSLGSDVPENWLGYDALLGNSASSPSPDSSVEVAMILYTAGTTGRPKGVVLTHEGLTAYPLENVNPADPDFEQRTLLSVPLYHVAGMQVLLSSIYGGRVVIVESQFEPSQWLRLVEEERVSRATVVPTMLKMVLEHPDFSTRDLSSMRILTYGAAPMPVQVILSAIERLPGVRFINAFGQTETGATITALPPEDHELVGDSALVEKRRRRLSSIGLPLDDVEVRVLDEDGAVVAVGEVGEIVARGPRLMKGYWGKEDDTAEAMRGGWLHTGDLGRMDDDGYVYLAGRARDFIKRGGEMISPEEVEGVLMYHPSVEDAAVIGIPDPHWGETICAVLVPEPGQSIDQEEIIEHCRAQLASYKSPESVVTVEELPRNALGKVLKRELRRCFGSG